MEFDLKIVRTHLQNNPPFYCFSSNLRGTSNFVSPERTTYNKRLSKLNDTSVIFDPFTSKVKDRVLSQVLIEGKPVL